MIAFVTLFLGLIAGPMTVEVAVSGTVRSVELRLDGRPVGSLGRPPWSTTVDFGELATHELVAVARDAAGAEVDRAVQLINVPSPQVETELLLDGWRQGRPRHSRIIWRSAEMLEPESISLLLDGEPVPVDDPSTVALPEVDVGSIHFLTVELTFPGNQRANAQAAFGGIYGFEVESELTAVPVLPADGPVERPEEARGWLRRPSGEPLRVVAVEEDVAEVMIVRDEASLPVLQRLDSQLERHRPRSWKTLSLAPADLLFMMSARPEIAAHPDVNYQLYPISRGYSLYELSLPRALARLGLKKRSANEPQLTDAVAVAGMKVAGRGRRRAVLLVVADCLEPSGRWSAGGVRRFLAELRVPLVVWATHRVGSKGGFCRGASRVKGTRTYTKALAHLRELLTSQQVLWVDGSHLPREIVLAEGAPATEVARPN